MSIHDELVIREAREADGPALAAFMQAQGQQRSTREYLEHWYFDNPTQGGSVTLGERDGAVVGMATMNAHRFRRSIQTALVAMPQKVLTHASLRGQGIFGKLYRASERACLERGADFFLTVTNSESTDIFLNKFGYLRLPSPGMTILLPLPGNVEFGSTDEWEPLASFGTENGEAWRMAKDRVHYRWRFVDHPLREYLFGRCSANGADLGCVFLKRVRKRAVPVMLLLDMVPAGSAASGDLLRAARKLTWKHGGLALLCLQEERFASAIAANSPVLRRSSGFNFLVKGRDQQHTHALAKQSFEISLGDLDFF